mmetsp:Transcript_22509/g.36183  ORF Transcript_22509/g.36183 Transcript_22509/m.36183 type:complete len:349 (+) Transcript_22509:123-1169(+)
MTTKDELARYMWESEILLRENAMMESFLAREKEISLSEDGDMDPPATASSKRRASTKAGRRKHAIHTLSLENKIFIAAKEMKHRQKQMAEMENDFQKEAINFKAMIKETETRIVEIKMEAYEFKRVVLAKGADPTTKKFRADLVIKYYDDKIRAKDALVEKLENKNSQLTSQIQKLEKRLNNKDHSGEKLSSIDFHQLKIENGSFSEKIEAKNRALLKLKVSTAKVAHMLTEKRALLNKLLSDSVDLRKSIAAAENREVQLKEELKKTGAIITSTKKMCNKLKLAQTVASDMPQIQDYVAQKDEEFELRKKIRQWETKCQLVSTAAKNARSEAIRAGGGGGSGRKYKA